jgi:hypothetical protein
MKYILRTIALPGVLVVFVVVYSILIFKGCWLWLRNGGELIPYRNDDRDTIDKIFRELKRGHKKDDRAF